MNIGETKRSFSILSGMPMQQSSVVSNLSDAKLRFSAQEMSLSAILISRAKNEGVQNAIKSIY